MNKQLKDLYNICDIQSQDGNWNYDEYMRGMANGLILAKSIFTGEDPDYKDTPKEGYLGEDLLDIKVLLKKINEVGTIQKTPILINPSKHEIVKLLRECGVLRFVVDRSGNYYIACAMDYIHREIKDFYKVDAKLRSDTIDGFIYITTK